MLDEGYNAFKELKERRAKPPPPSAGPASAADLASLTTVDLGTNSFGSKVGSRWLYFESLWSSYRLTLTQKVDKMCSIAKYYEKVLT